MAAAKFNAAAAKSEMVLTLVSDEILKPFERQYCAFYNGSVIFFEAKTPSSFFSSVV
jgi:hypothetical protein